MMPALMKWSRGAAALAVLAITLTCGAEARAAGGQAAEQRVEDLPDGRLKKKLQAASERAAEAGHSASLLKRPVGEALRAFERARGAAAAGDVLHAAQLRDLSDRWVRVANTLVSAADAEKAADAQQQKAQELTTKLQRAEQLLAEQQASLGRLSAALKAAQARLKRRRDANAAAARVAGKDDKPKRK